MSVNEEWVSERARNDECTYPCNERKGDRAGEKYPCPYENIDYTFLRVHSLRRVLISRNAISPSPRVARKILLAYVRESLPTPLVFRMKIRTGNVRRIVLSSSLLISRHVSLRGHAKPSSSERILENCSPRSYVRKFTLRFISSGDFILWRNCNSRIDRYKKPREEESFHSRKE